MKKNLHYLVWVVLLSVFPFTMFSQNKTEQDTALSGAVKRDDLALVKKLVAKGAEINHHDSSGATILMLAVSNNNFSMVKYLIGKGAQIDQKGTLDDGSYIMGNALSVAIINRNEDIVYYLLEKCKCNITEKDINYTLKDDPGKHFDLNDFDKDDYTDGVILSYLFLHGVDISLYELAAFDGTDYFFKYYLKYNPDFIDKEFSNNRTLLHHAAEFNRDYLTEYLLKHGADADAKDTLGITPYCLAREYGNQEVIELLVSFGADTTVCNDIEEPPPDITDIKEPEQIRKPALGLPLGHTEKINSVSFSEDGKLEVTSSNDNTAKIWETASGKLLHSLEGHNGYVNFAEFTPDSKYVVTQSYDGTVRTWNTVTGRLLNSFNCNTFVTPFICGDSKTVYVSISNYLLKYNISSGKLSSSRKFDGEIKGTMHNKDLSLLLVSLGDNTIEVIDPTSDKVIYSLAEINSQKNQFIPIGFFSNSNRYLCVVSHDSVADVLEPKTGKLLYNINAQKGLINVQKGLLVKVLYSTDDRYFLTRLYLDNNVKVWNAADGNMLFSLNLGGNFPDADFSPDGNYIYSTRNDEYFRIWEVPSGKLVFSRKTYFTQAKFLSDENKIILTSSDSIRTIEIPTWKIIQSLAVGSQNRNEIKTGQASSRSGHTLKILSADFSRGNDSLLIVSQRGIRFIDIVNGRILSLIPTKETEKTVVSPDKKLIALIRRSPSYFDVYDLITGKSIISDWNLSAQTSACFSPDAKKIASSYLDKSIKIWDCSSGKLIRKITGLEDGVNDVTFSPDGKYLAASLFNGKFVIWNTSDYSVLLERKGHYDVANSISFSHNGNYIVSSSNDTTACVWDLPTGKLISRLKAGQYWISNAMFSPDDKFIITSTSSVNRISKTTTTIRFAGNNSLGIIRVWDPYTGNLIKALEGHLGGIEDLTFSPDNKYLITASKDQNAIIWDCSTWKLLYMLGGHSSGINSARFSSDGKTVIIASNDSRVKFWDASTGREILTWIAVDSTDWVVISPSGLFDATPGAMKLMYYIQGLDVIDLEQLKERYYEPNLWSKLMGFNPEPPRDVKGLDEIKLYPSVKLKISDNVLSFTLKDQGGGIGQYMVYINGKEAFTGNQKSDSLQFRGTPEISSTFNLKNHPYLIAGKENEIVVKAYNGENYLVNRGEKILFTPRGEISSEKPRLFILTSGVSDYTGDQIDLRFAAKDADNITTALELGAKRLFGSEKTFTYRLSTTLNDKTYWPTKQNILAAFGKIAGEARSSDIVVVYISGHGINLGAQDGDFFYLTQEAYTANSEAYKDISIRDKTTISSSELTELIRKIPALKQVLIIDACGSGRTVENLIAQRDISSSTLRALDRMKDRTGLHIITGCAADAVSYEASRYGQGVLTYSLLEGMKGASLREDKFADVIQLFQYGRERVPELARGIGGIQQPQTFSPYGEASFDIGEFDIPDKALIPLAAAKPIVLMSSLKDKETFDDIVGIEKLVDDRLREISSGDKDARFVFVGTKDFPEAVKIRGQYTVSGNNITVTVNIFKGSVKTTSFVVNGLKTELKKLSDEIVGKISFK